jgi:radical SAM superfamily enzyme YgiQ (UPF0313 family)
MRIGLVDVDGHNFPNLCLMKISAWHKSKGDTVEWAVPLGDYDKVYKSKVFTFTKDDKNSYGCEIEKGGSGYGDYNKKLSDEIEHLCPDYSIYNINDVAYGFTTRGCIRKCPFCVVPKKEGNIRPHADIEEFLDGRKNLILMDNNIMASDHGIKQLEKCKNMGIKVDCNQGLDARIVSKSDYLINLIANLYIYGDFIRIACDNKSEIEPCKKVVDKVLEINPKRKFSVYTLLTDDEEDSMERVMLWRNYGSKVKVYAPPYRNFNDPNQYIPKWQKNLARWANNRWIYYSCDFKDYNSSVKNSKHKEKDSNNLWEV